MFPGTRARRRLVSSPRLFLSWQITARMSPMTSLAPTHLSPEVKKLSIFETQHVTPPHGWGAGTIQVPAHEVRQGRLDEAGVVSLEPGAAANDGARVQPRR